MAEVTKPLALDETLQALVAASGNIEQAIRGVSLGNYVIVNINNYTWGSVTGAGVYPVGSPVTLHATPATGAFFLAWRNANGDVLSTEDTYTFTPSRNTVIQADFNDQAFVKIVSWANGTDVELNAMLQAHYAGIIDIHDYWSVGDTRAVHLDAMPQTDGTVTVSESHIAQGTEWVLMDSTLDGIKLATDGVTAPAFAVGMKGTLIEDGSMNLTQTSVGGWKECVRRAWCNSIFYNALPNTFKQLFKQFVWRGVTDFFAFAPERCVIGMHERAGDDESMFTLWEWYANSENRNKKRGLSGSLNSWLLSSTFAGYAMSFLRVAYGRIDGAVASLVFGISPFGCI